MKQLSLKLDIPIADVYTFNADCKSEIQRLIENGIMVDSIVTDPPYEIGFMGKSWDSTGIAYDKEMWELCLQVLKPGGHLLAFGGSRTYHRMACAIEDAGFEIRDQIMWVYGQGFPKSLNISKALDKMAGAERKSLGDARMENRIAYRKGTGALRCNICGNSRNGTSCKCVLPQAATDAAKQWDGWGSALKPSHEPICMARKPLDKNCNIAQNVLKHGTGGINVDGCRVEGQPRMTHVDGSYHTGKCGYHGNLGAKQLDVPTGRFPANLIHDGSDEVMEEFAKYGERKNGHAPKLSKANPFSGINDSPREEVYFKDTGTASRFFYSAKASKKDRCGSKHPTVKPISLMRYLCRLVTPPGGTVLDPFAGSGTTGQAAREEGFCSILIEKDKEFYNDILTRMRS